MLTSSPYAAVAGRMRDQGYSVMPCGPGTKVPSTFTGGQWRPMPGWARYCDAPAPEFVHDGWERWPDAGVCLAHGAVIGLDLDTDRPDVAAALHSALVPPTVRRRGKKGWMGYYRPAAGLEDLTARVRWYDKSEGSDRPVVELLLHGTQSVLPPTIHPDTGKPYQWLTPDTLENTPPADLPTFGGGEFAALDAAFRAIGLTRQAPRKMVDAGAFKPGAPDLELPFFRSFNNRALESIDQWFPLLALPKTRQRGPGKWEAVAMWRASGSGRSITDRNPNLRTSFSGITDFGDNRGYTAIDLVMSARDCGLQGAQDFLEPFLRPENGLPAAPAPVAAVSAPEPAESLPAPAPEPVRAMWSTMPTFRGERVRKITPAPRPTDAEFKAMFPVDMPPFPIRNYTDCPGLLGAMADYLDCASATATETGGLAVALPVLGALMGRGYESPTGLRTNIYTVALGSSGTGKTSLTNPAKEIMTLAKASEYIGADRIKSGSGLITMLSDGRPKICFMDELGHMLKALTAPGAGIHSREILTELTQLYSSANTIFTGAAYADGQRKPLESPHLCLFGMATPDQFWGAFGSGALEDGTVARYLVMPIGASAPKEPDKAGQGDIAQAALDIMSAIGARVTGNLGLPRCHTVPMTDGAERARMSLVRTMEGCAAHADETGVKGGPPILRRVAENAVKIAIVSAVGRDPISPMIDETDFAIGHAIARWSATVMLSNIASHIADNEQERNVNAVLRFIREAGKAGRAWRDVQRRFRAIKSRDLKDIVDGLQADGSIAAERVQGQNGGQPFNIFHLS